MGVALFLEPLVEYDLKRPTFSRPVYNSGVFSGLPGNRVDSTARQRTGSYSKDPVQRLAKVRVAGSNPVVRSKLQSAVQSSNLGCPCTGTSESDPTCTNWDPVS